MRFARGGCQRDSPGFLTTAGNSVESPPIDKSLNREVVGCFKAVRLKTFASQSVGLLFSVLLQFRKVTAVAGDKSV